MSRLTALNPDEATGKTKELFDAVKNKMGMVPNMMRTMGNSPAVLESYLGFNAGLQHSAINPRLKELIAITVANVNGCDYCNSAHTFISQKIGLESLAIADARSGKSEDRKTEAALVFAKQILETRGSVDDTDLSAIKNAGYTETEIVEIIAQVSLSIFTNYMNIISSTDIDFPKLPLIEKELAGSY